LQIGWEIYNCWGRKAAMVQTVAVFFDKKKEKPMDLVDGF